jgi:putative transposase
MERVYCDSGAFGWRSGSPLRYGCELDAALAAEVRLMAAPHRGKTGYSTYFITTSTFQKQSLLQTDRMANLFTEVLLGYGAQQKYLLHEFVLMPNHFHLLITPTLTLERALQLIKGGFSFRAKRELGFAGEIWEKSFYDRRVRDWEEYCAYRSYIHMNPVKKGLAVAPGEYPYSSARPGFVLDAVPQRLKPSSLIA